MRLADLANVARWCAWREETRGGRSTKVPYGAGGAPMQSNNPATWVTLAQAQAMDAAMARAAAEHGEGDKGHGVGILLGPLGNGCSLVGLDLDTCLGQSADGIERWAAEALQACPTYAEVSPSGTGIKTLMLLRDENGAAVRLALGIGPSQHGRKLGSARAAGSAHPPAIDVYLGVRYFAITGESVGDGDDFAMLTPDMASRLMAIAHDAFGGRKLALQAPVSAHMPSNSAAFPAGRFSNFSAIGARVAELAAAQPVFAGLLEGRPGPGQHDLSRSGFADAIMRWLAWAGWSSEDASEAMAGMDGARGDDGSTVAAWMAEKGMALGGREFSRAWERWSGTGARHAGGAPVGAGLGAVPAGAGGSGSVLGPGERMGTPEDTPPPAVTEVSGLDDGSGLPLFSDEALARRMGDRLADGENAMRYVAAWGKWVVWDGVRWRIDEVSTGLRAARAICAEMAPMAGKDAKSVASARTVHAVEGLVRADMRIATKVDEWDQHPWLLNTAEGVIDLRTGQVSGNAPALRITRAAAARAEKGAQCPLWRSFLLTVMDGKQHMADFLQRIAGYCLTGVTWEDALFFLHGGGDNGKSTFVDTLAWIMGDGEDGYAKVADIDTFAARKGDHHLTELARLRGARLVTTSETEEGRGWNEARIKQVTGGSPITANFMRQDYFTFSPEFKLVVSGNHKPRIKAPDVAFRRRMNVIPFEVRIPEDRKDKALGDKLRAEAPGILWWAVEGCLRWQMIGLAPPPEVTAATDSYMQEEDARSAWLRTFVREKRGSVVSQRDMFLSWRGWAEQGNEHPGNQRAFGDWMRSQGFDTKKDEKTMMSIYENVEIVIPTFSPPQVGPIRGVYEGGRGEERK